MNEFLFYLFWYIHYWYATCGQKLWFHNPANSAKSSIVKKCEECFQTRPKNGKQSFRTNFQIPSDKCSPPHNPRQVQHLQSIEQQDAKSLRRAFRQENTLQECAGHWLTLGCIALLACQQAPTRGTAGKLPKVIGIVHRHEKQQLELFVSIRTWILPSWFHLQLQSPLKLR